MSNRRKAPEQHPAAAERRTKQFPGQAAPLTRFPAPPPWALALCAALLTAAVYLRVTGFDFINLDDPIYVTDNPHVLAGLTLDSLRWAFGFNDIMYWQPVTWLSLLVDGTLYGNRAGGYHLTNAALHCANVALLYFLVLRWFNLARPVPEANAGGKWAALAVALAFGLHPVHVESVAWVSERKDMLFVFFGLLTLRSYTNYAQCRADGLKTNLLPALLLYAASLLSKPMLVTLPALLLLLDFWPLRRLRLWQNGSDGPTRTGLGPLLLEKAFFLLPAAAMSALTLLTHPKAYGATDPALALKLANAVASYLDYLRLLVFPAGLGLVYPFPEAVPAAKLAAAIILLLGVSATALWQLKRRPQLAVGWFWFLGTLAPVLIPPKVGLHVAYADRWSYFPFIGLYLGLAMLAWEGLARLADSRLRSGLTAGLLAALCLALGVATHLQLGWWKNSMTVYERALAVTDDNYFVMNNYGVLKMRARDFSGAEKWIRMSLSVQPHYSKALGNLGILYTNTGRYSLALPYFARALEQNTLDPNELAEDHYCMGLCLSHLGRYNEAEHHYLAALKHKPDYSQAYNDLGNIAIIRKQLGVAEGHFAKAVTLNPQYDVARNNLSQVRALLAAVPTESSAQNP